MLKAINKAGNIVNIVFAVISPICAAWLACAGACMITNKVLDSYEEK